MAWTHVLCDGQPECPGRVILSLGNGHSSLVVYSEKDGIMRTFPCSVPALLGVQRGTRTHLASEAGECVLSKEADGVHIKIHTIKEDDLTFFVPSDEFLISLTKLVEAKAVQRRVSLQ
jgi:hypothetical protein